VINRLFEYFGYRKIEECQKEFPYSKSNYICFIVDPKNNEPTIRINIADLSDIGCLKYSELILNMNFGAYQKNIGSILQNLSKKDPDIEAFVHNLTLNLDNLLQEIRLQELDNINKLSLKPLVKPTHFQNNVK